MILVYDTFVCKPGNASKVAKMFKEVMAKNPYLMGIMTDMTGQYHRVVMATGYKTLAEFEKSYDEMMNNPNKEAAFSNDGDRPGHRQGHAIRRLSAKGLLGES